MHAALEVARSPIDVPVTDRCAGHNRIRIDSHHLRTELFRRLRAAAVRGQECGPCTNRYHGQPHWNCEKPGALMHVHISFYAECS